MKKVYQLVSNYFKESFSWKLYASILVLCTILISLNYTFKIEKDFINSFHGTPWRGVLLFLLTFFSYLLACLLIHSFTDKKDIFRQKGFWFSTFFIFIVYGIYSGTYFEKLAIHISNVSDIYIYWYKILGETEQIVFGVLPLLLLYWFYDKKEIGHFYGLQSKNVDIKPYVLLLLLMVIPIYLASTTEGFQNAYPKAIRSHYTEFALLKNISSWKPLFAYEFVYLASFISIELIFRGFLIYRMEKYLGDYVVLPMIVTYSVIHFGKPVGETISSIGGGYILGVLALSTRNIYGGVFIHIGIALLMEIFAFLQR